MWLTMKGKRPGIFSKETIVEYRQCYMQFSSTVVVLLSVRKGRSITRRVYKVIMLIIAKKKINKKDV